MKFTKEEILTMALTGDHYYSNEDLRINKKIGIMLNNQKLNDYLNYKESIENEAKVILPLLSFNSKSIFYYNSCELSNAINDYFIFFKNNSSTQETIISENYDEIILSRVASELEGTLKIEGVNTTRKKILEIVKEKKVKNANEQIILNMCEGYSFISKRPPFTKDNLRELYRILSKDSLPKTDEIKDYYRTEMVMIGGHDGCSIDKIEACMDSLFKFVNDNLEVNNPLLPFIAHYYLLYVHPYIDFNGRTARMVSLWISMLMKMEGYLPTFISEAINDDKANYYKAIDNSRNSCNDLTYFLTYLYQLSNKYYLVYKNINEIKKNLAKEGEGLTATESYYLKRIIINKKYGWFNYRGFINFCGLDITKQGALKILNNFVKHQILQSRINSKNEKIFIMNEDFLKYELN